MTTNTHATARAAHAAGFSVIPPSQDGVKKPMLETWKDYQKERPTLEQIARWYEQELTGVGVVLGKVSGNTEALDSDDEDVYFAYRAAAEAAGIADVLEKIEAGYLERTPNGGRHSIYKCDQIAGSTKLAQRPLGLGPDGQPRFKTLIETKGEGGYIIIAPSNGKVHETGGAYELLRGGLDTIATITPEERLALLELAQSFDEVHREKFPEPKTLTPGGSGRPGDEFNQQADWTKILSPHGWTLVYERNEATCWRRPGKDRGISATTNFDSSGYFYCFSTSTPFDIKRGYSKFAVYAILNHGGDFSAAARALAADGYGTSIENTETEPWPDPLAQEALYGLAGDIVRAIEPSTESDPAAILLQTLVAFGNAAGHGPYFPVEADKHTVNLDAVLVGETANGRKGTSWGQVYRLFFGADFTWATECIQAGLSSGEGLIHAVRDPILKLEPIKENGKRTGEYEEVVVDQGVEDKRLFVLESEFASTLRVMQRDGNTLSPIIRQLWDHGNLRVLTKNSPEKATGAHGSITGHVTKDELLRYMDSSEYCNGFGNRFLWLCVRRSKCLPEGGQVDENALARLIERLEMAIAFAGGVGEMTRDDKARDIWRQVYPDLSEGQPGMLGAVTSRAAAQVVRLSCIYALLDRSAVIRAEHLMAALAVWQYCQASARWIFGDALGDPVADELLRALRANPAGLKRVEISEFFGRNKSASQLTRALGLLVERGLASSVVEKDTGGRPAERWVAR